MKINYDCLSWLLLSKRQSGRQNFIWSFPGFRLFKNVIKNHFLQKFIKASAIKKKRLIEDVRLDELVRLWKFVLRIVCIYDAQMSKMPKNFTKHLTNCFESMIKVGSTSLRQDNTRITQKAHSKWLKEMISMYMSWI